jgi:hypothetical protein
MGGGTSRILVGRGANRHEVGGGRWEKVARVAPAEFEGLHRCSYSKQCL